MASDKIVNDGRQFELDVAKAFAVLFMIIVHVQDYLTEAGDGFFSDVISFLGDAPAAGVFMFAMGIGMVYTRHDTPKDFAVRGVKLLLIGYALNFFRETLPILLSRFFDVAEGLQEDSLYTSLMEVDILQFAGVSFLLVALFKKFQIRPWGILAAALVFHAAGDLFPMLFHGIPEAIQYPLGILFPVGGGVGASDDIAFSASGWFIYPAFGICFGYLLKRISCKDCFYRIVAVLGVAAVICILAGCAGLGTSIYDMFMTDAYYKQDILTASACLSIVLLCLPVYYAVSKAIVGRGATAVKWVSANINIVYIIQWLLIDWTIAVMELLDLDLLLPFWTIPVSVAVTIFCMLISLAWHKIRMSKA